MANEKRLIDKEPIKKFIEGGLNNPDRKNAFGYDAIQILAEIEFAPTVDAVEVVHGRWEKAEYDGWIRCDKCKDVYIAEGYLGSGKWNYCPNCGARMRGDDE